MRQGSLGPLKPEEEERQGKRGVLFRIFQSPCLLEEVAPKRLEASS